MLMELLTPYVKAARTGSPGAAPGGTTPGIAGRRTGTSGRPTTGTTTWGSVSRGRHLNVWIFTILQFYTRDFFWKLGILGRQNAENQVKNG